MKVVNVLWAHKTHARRICEMSMKSATRSVLVLPHLFHAQLGMSHVRTPFCKEGSCSMIFLL